MDRSVTAVDVRLDWATVRVLGPDAERYLQSQLSQDLGELEGGERWALLLEPDGVVVTSCLVRRVESGFELAVPRELGESALARLRRFHLRSDCTLELFDRDEGPFARTSELVDASWPGANEFRAQLTPQSFGGHFVASTVSFTKGCYTGQELVARLDARASNVPWRLARLSGPSVERLEEAVRLKGPEGPRGVTTAVVRAGRVDALAIVHRTLLDPAARAELHDVEITAST